MWPWLPERVVVVHIPCVLLNFLSHCGNRSSGACVRLDGLSSLDRSTGEVGVRGALGPSPPCTSEDKRPSKGEWDDGGLAGTLSSPAGQPSTPGTYGGLVCPNLAGRGSTVAQRDGATLLAGGEVSGESREAGEAGGAQAAFVRFWVAGRIDSCGPYWLLAPNG